MNPLKQRHWILTVLLCVLLLCLPASAHSGGTDSAGGHYDHSTGEYHYHHGYPAHQHPDGVCPYDFDDQTGQDSGSSGSSRADTSPAIKTCLVLTGVIAVLIPALFLVIKAQERKQKEDAFRKAEELRREEEQRRKAEEEAKRREAERQKFEQEKAELQQQYGGMTRSDLARACGMPDDTELDADGYPYSDSTQYIFYIAPRGSVYHRTKNCNSSATTPVHLAKVYFEPSSLHPLNRRRACTICNPLLPDLGWWEKYHYVWDRLCAHDLISPDQSGVLAQPACDNDQNPAPPQTHSL